MVNWIYRRKTLDKLQLELQQKLSMYAAAGDFDKMVPLSLLNAFRDNPIPTQSGTNLIKWFSSEAQLQTMQASKRDDYKRAVFWQKLNPPILEINQ